MCGIAGIVNFNPGPDVEQSAETVRNMTESLRHRGPDETGFYTDHCVALGHSRLSIIDLETGTQPVSNEDESITVIFNGEIFNYPELREYLRKKGHVFKTSGDTEIIVHLYEEYGTGCFSHLNGQFAIALYDKNKSQVILARDRVGIRPLYFHESEKRLIFASEIKAIFRNRDIARDFDYQGLNQLFTFWTTVPPCTIYNDIKELPPGHILTFSIDSDSAKITRYWQLEFPDNGECSGMSFVKTVDEVRGRLIESVKLRLRSDVTVASYLSGGLDSTIISSMVSKYFNNDLMTFSLTFDNQDYDENSYQNEVLSMLKTNHKSVNVSTKAIISVFGDVIRHTEIPIFRTSPAPMYILSRFVNGNGIKVVLTGEGADEIFGGYNIFREDKIRRFWNKRPDSLYRKHLLDRLYPYIQREDRTRHFWYHFFGKNLGETESPFYSHFIRWKNNTRLKNYLSEDIRNSMSEYDAYEDLLTYCNSDILRWHPQSRAQYLEMILFMSGYLLSSQGDRMMMANSVEGRFPFLDHNLIEFTASIPPNQKIFGLNEKYILKKAFQDIIPESITARDKQPYRAPVSEIFKEIFKNKKDNNDNSEYNIKESALFDQKNLSMLLMKLSESTLSAVDEMSIAGLTSLEIIKNKFIENIPVK